MKKIIISLTLILLLLFSLTACSDSQSRATDFSEKKPEVIRLTEVAHSIFYAPMYVAIENSYFNDNQIDLQLNCGFGADKVMTALLSNETDIGFMGPEATIYTNNQGANDKIVNFAQLTQRAGNFLVGRKKINNFSWDMLKDQLVIGGRKGGMPEMVFEYILKQNGLDPVKDLTIEQNIDFGSTAAAFSGGKGDYTVEFEPAATLLEEEGKGYVIASLGIDSGYVPYTAFSAKESFLSEHPDTVQHFTDALQLGMNYVQSHSPEEIAAVIAPQFPETDLSTLTTIVERYYTQNTWKTDLIFKKDSFELLQDILESAGELDHRAVYSDLVTTKYAEKALEQ